MGRKVRFSQLLIVLGGLLLLLPLILQPLLRQSGAHAPQPTDSPPDSAGVVNAPAGPTVSAPGSAPSSALPPLSSPGPSATPVAPTFALIDGFGGLASALALNGNLLYAGEGSGLVVFDIADRQQPVRLNRTVLPGRVAALQVVNNRAYIASFEAGLLILDLSNPRAPRLVGAFATPGQARNLQVVDNRVYLGQFGGPFQIIDVDDPARPRLVGSYQPPATPVEVAVSGARAYLAADQAGLTILDLHDPARPTFLGEYKGAPVIFDVAAHGALVYLATPDGLTILDLTDPDAPKTVGAFYITGGAAAVLLNGQMALVVGSGGAVTMLDVSNPAAPNPVGRFGCAGCNFGAGGPLPLVVHGDQAFVASGDGGIQIIDLSSPAMPRTLSATPGSLREALGVRVVGTTAYVAAGDDGLYILDLGKPGGPVLLGSDDTLGHVSQVEVVGSVAYLASTSGVQIIDVSNPRDPRLLAAITDVSAISLQVAGDRLYVGSALDSTLTIFDVRDPVRPRRLGATGIPLAVQVTVSGGYAFVAEGGNGLRIYDVNDPAAITQIGAYQGSHSGDRALGAIVYGVDVVGSTAYLATNVIGSAGMQIIDVSDPSRPHLLGYAPTYAEGRDVQVVDRVAYVAAGDEGVYAFDAGDPARPRLIGRHKTPDTAFDVEVVGERLYVAARQAGLMVFWLGAGPAPTPLPIQMSPTGQATATPVAKPTVTAAAPAETLAPLGAIDGAVSTVAISGTLAYLGTSSGLTVLDLADPARPVALGRLPEVTSDDPRPAELLIVGTQGYLANGNSGLAILDLADPQRPALRGRYLPARPYPGEFQNPVGGVAVVGAYAYVAAGQSGLLILDVSAPEQPILISQISVGAYAAEVQVIGKLAYVAYRVPYSRMLNARAGIGIVDVSNPAAPILIGSYDLTDNTQAGNLYVDGVRAFLVSGDGQLRSFDVTNPARIMPLGAFDAGGSISWLHVDGPLAYALVSEQGMQIIDVSDPAWPRRRGAFALQEPGAMVKVAGGLALISSGSGLTILDVANPDAPQPIGRRDTVPEARRLVVEGERVFIVEGDAGLRIFDLRDPDRPLLVGSYTSPQPVVDIAVAGEHIFVATEDELHTLKSGNGLTPTPVGAYRLPGRAAAVKLRDGLAYVAITSDSLRQTADLVILNIKNPARPRLVGQASIRLAMAFGLYVAEDRAYLLGSEGWAIVDVSNPATPQLLGLFSEQRVKAIVVENDVGYVLSTTLKVFDLRDGAQPALIAIYAIPARDIALHAQRLYLVGNDRVSVFDISDPRSPLEIGGIAYSGLGNDIAIAGNRIYVSSRMGGVRVLSIAP